MDCTVKCLSSRGIDRERLSSSRIEGNSGRDCPRSDSVPPSMSWSCVHVCASTGRFEQRSSLLPGTTEK